MSAGAALAIVVLSSVMCVAIIRLLLGFGEWMGEVERRLDRLDGYAHSHAPSDHE